MKRSVSHEKLAICTFELDKSETRFGSVGEIVDYLRACIEAERSPASSPCSTTTHTRDRCRTASSPRVSVPRTNLVFCFGITLPDPQALALRPRSLGVCELEDQFVLTFAEAPMPVANLAMERWALSVGGREKA